MIYLTRGDCRVFFVLLVAVGAVHLIPWASETSPAPSGERYCINLNRAPLHELELIRQVGQKTARQIVDARPFTGYDSFFARLPRLRAWEVAVRKETWISVENE